MTASPQPFTSALILAYNSEDYICEAIASIISQTTAVDELVISDDSSTDATFLRAQQYVDQLRREAVFCGEVKLTKNPQNLGFIAHFNQAVSSCTGDLILYNAGDDISAPDRLTTILSTFSQREDPRYFLAHSAVRVLGGDRDGSIRFPPTEVGTTRYNIERLANSCALHMGATQCFTKALFEDFGPIRFEDAYEDLILGFRALLTEAVVFIPKPLLLYRTGGLSSWQKNCYEKKRSRYKAVLNQRILDATNWGRFDLVNEMLLAYQEYGFSRRPSPDRIDIFSPTPVKRRLFEYRLDEHIDNAPQAFRGRSMSDLIDLKPACVDQEVSKHQLLYLALAEMDWQRIEQCLTDASQVQCPVILDFGVQQNTLVKCLSARERFDCLTRFLKFSANRFVVTPCHALAIPLKRRFGERCLLSPLFVDFDGPDPSRPDSKLDHLHALVLAEPGRGDPQVHFDSVINELKDRLCAKSLVLHLPDTTNQAVYQELFSDSALHNLELRTLQTNDFALDDLASFSAVLLLGSDHFAAQGLFTRITLNAYAQKIPVFRGNERGVNVPARSMTQLREEAYFEHSFQRQIHRYIAFFRHIFNDKSIFHRLHPL